MILASPSVTSVARQTTHFIWNNTSVTNKPFPFHSQDARIIVGLFYVVAARRVLCEMYKQGLYGSSYVWFFIGWYEDNWYEANLAQEKIECTREQMKEAAEGHLTTEALNWNQDNQKTISGMVLLSNRLVENPHLIPWHYLETRQWKIIASV